MTRREIGPAPALDATATPEATPRSARSCEPHDSPGARFDRPGPDRVHAPGPDGLDPSARRDRAREAARDPADPGRLESAPSTTAGPRPGPGAGGDALLVRRLAAARAAGGCAAASLPAPGPPGVITEIFAPADDPALAAVAAARPRLPAPGEVARALAVPAVVALDLETTGLDRSYARPAIACLVHPDPSGSTWVARQWTMTGPADERAVLAAVLRAIAALPQAALLTYNGSSFDLPLLRARALRAALDAGALARTHVDLYRWLRRIHRREHGSLALGALERAVLGWARRGDVPGAAIPELVARAWADPRAAHAALAPARLHNRIDVYATLSLAARWTGCPILPRLAPAGPSPTPPLAAGVAAGLARDARPLSAPARLGVGPAPAPARSLPAAPGSAPTPTRHGEGDDLRRRARAGEATGAGSASRAATHASARGPGPSARRPGIHPHPLAPLLRALGARPAPPPARGWPSLEAVDRRYQLFRRR